MRGYSFEGVILKRSNLKDTDKIITFFTRDHGKLTVVAKGIRKASSRRSGTLELFNRVQGHTVPGKGELRILTEVKLVDSYHAWRAHLGRITMAYQLCEAIDKLTVDGEPHTRLYVLLTSRLSQIRQLGADWQTQTDIWLLDIIQQLGFWPSGKSFTGSIVDYIEDLANTRLNSPRLLKRLHHSQI